MSWVVDIEGQKGVLMNDHHDASRGCKLMMSKEAGVAPSLLFNWRRRMLEGGLQAV